ncbi:MAG: hypothetical protein CML03_00880 [Pseudooceanicola sp.]|nr:hypothetical protein [Pseudooceanicola sp.]|tara:strand:- start:13002 stop:13364 length:363 start_codon:yes stop_codon:yes gene_type:complete
MSNNHQNDYGEPETWHVSKAINPAAIITFVLAISGGLWGTYTWYEGKEAVQNTSITANSLQISANAAIDVQLKQEITYIKEMQKLSDQRQDEVRQLVREQLVRVESKLDNIENYLRDASK